MKSRSYSSKTLKILFAQSRNLCAYPECTNNIIEPATEQSDDQVIGQVCHIYALSEQGPRGNSGLTKEELNSPENLILLCPTHHAIVDGQHESYPAEKLKEWKQNHESRIQESLRNLEPANVNSLSNPNLIVISTGEFTSNTDQKNMRKSYNKPQNPEDFEILCLKLLRVHWKCPELDRYAIRGQAQNGVDILDLSGQDPLRAAQCKLREEGKRITRTQVRNEIEKARKFKPPLDRYVIMTTGKVGKEVQDFLVETNRKHREKNLFKVEVFGWDRIEELLDEHTDVRDWYEGGALVSAVRIIESKFDEFFKIQRTPTQDLGSDNQGGLDAEIDEARGFLEKHNYQMAKLLLRRIRERSWDRLSARQKFRLLTSLADVEASTDNPKGAADRYLEAKKHQPHDEAARINEALAYLMLEQHERAYGIACELKEEFPRSERVLLILIQSAPDSATLEQIKDSIPEDLLEKDEVAIPLARRALNCGDLRKAEEFIRAAADAGSQTSETWLRLGQIIFQMEISRSAERYGTEGVFRDGEKLLEAEAALGKALELAGENSSVSEKIETLLTRREVRTALGKNAEAREDLEEAGMIAPGHAAVIEASAKSLWVEGKLDEAIGLMRRVPAETFSDQDRIILGMMLMERGGPGDYSDAGELFSQAAKSEEELQEDFRENAIELGLRAFAKEERFDACRRLLEEVPAGVVSDINLKTLAAKLHLLEGKKDKASGCADDALALTNDATTVFEIRRLALLLFELKRFEDALPLWQRIAAPDAFGFDTRHLLQCAHLLERHDVMLGIFRELRRAGVVSKTLFDMEFSFFREYDVEETIRILDEEIGRWPEDKELGLLRSALGLEFDRPELVDSDPLSIPGAEEVNPHAAPAAVSVLKAIGQEQRAIRYAYDVLRCNFRDPDAHRAFIISFSDVPGDEPQLRTPDCVETGSAVCYVEQGESSSRWIIVEDSPDDHSQFPEQELSPDHHLCEAMKGKKAGDTFTLASGIVDRIGEIREIRNKYVYRYQDCLEQWQVRFPGLMDVQVLPGLGKNAGSGEPEPDISTLLDIVDKRHEEVLKFEQIYKENPLPLHVFGERFGSNAFEAVLNLAGSPSGLVKCCEGSMEENRRVSGVFESRSTVVLDMSAISSLFLLDELDILKNWPVDLVVSANTVAELRRMIADKIPHHSRESQVLLKADSGHASWERSSKEKMASIEKLRNLVHILETACEVRPCVVLAELEPKKRDILIQAFGRYGAETILLACMPEAVLWTDDLVQAKLAGTEYGVSHVWTQFVIEKCAESNIVRPEVFLEASAKLLGYGYSFTAKSPDIIRQAAVIAEWKIDEWPFSQALSFFAEEPADLMQVIMLTAHFLKLLYQEPLPLESRKIITEKILENIAGKEGGIQGIFDLRRNLLPIIFGLNVVGLAQVIETIDAWLARIRNF